MALRIYGWIPAPAMGEVLARYFEWLGPLVQVRFGAPVREGQYVPRLDGGAPVILLPLSQDDVQLAQWGFHEAGHVVHRHGLASYLRTHGNLAVRQQRVLFRLAEMKEERQAREHMLAMLLPSPMVQQVRSDRELSRMTGLSPAAVQERRIALRGKVFHLDYAPRWSAWHEHTVKYIPSPLAPHFLVRSHEGPGAWRIPAGEGPEDTCFQINADLQALSVDEWARKYAPAFCPEGARTMRRETKQLYAYLREHAWLDPDLLERVR